jgi:integrase
MEVTSHGIGGYRSGCRCGVCRFAGRVYRGTRNLRAVQALLGHESIATTERSTAVDDMPCPGNL